MIKNMLYVHRAIATKIILGIIALIVFGGMLVVCPLSAEEVILKNQDRLTGTIIGETDEVIILETEAMGSVTIQKQFVQAQKTHENEMGIAEETTTPWRRKISAGYTQVSGNTQKAQSSLGVQLHKKTEDDEFILKGEHYYAATDKKMDAQKWDGMVRYAYSFWERKWYNFYKVEADHDRFANIDYRLIPSVGVGYWFSDTADWKAMVEGALGFEHTNFRDATKDSNEAIFVGRGFLEKSLFGESRIAHDTFLYPSLSETGEYRIHSETSFINPINGVLSLRLSLILDHDSHPPKDTKKTDTRFTTSLQYSF